MKRTLTRLIAIAMVVISLNSLTLSYTNYTDSDSNNSIELANDIDDTDKRK